MKNKPGKNKWWYAFKVIIGLTILTFFISIIISAFIGEDFESLSGNVAVIDITGTILAEKGSTFLFEDITSSEEITKLIRRADKNPN